jgi:diadenosine tetraphosphate (Ap4A) HIT family hydrolase
MLFAEMPGYAHLHVHVVPRMADVPADELGPGVFVRLGVAEDQRVPVEDMDRLAVAIRQAAGR